LQRDENLHAKNFLQTLLMFLCFLKASEKLFDSFVVPDVLKSELLLMYLSDKVKSLLLRLEQRKQERYDEVEAFLLNALMAKTQGFYKVVRASAVTHRKLQISKVGLVTLPNTRLTYSKGL
jgi:hypothetical protein